MVRVDLPLRIECVGVAGGQGVASPDGIGGAIAVSLGVPAAENVVRTGEAVGRNLNGTVGSAGGGLHGAGAAVGFIGQGSLISRPDGVQGNLAVRHRSQVLDQLLILVSGRGSTRVRGPTQESVAGASIVVSAQGKLNIVSEVLSIGHGAGGFAVAVKLHMVGVGRPLRYQGGIAGDYVIEEVKEVGGLLPAAEGVPGAGGIIGLGGLLTVLDSLVRNVCAVRAVLIEGYGVAVHRPRRRVAPIAGAARVDGDSLRRGAQIRARPAREGITFLGRVAQGDGIALDGVGLGVCARDRAAIQIISNSISGRRKGAGQSHVAVGHGELAVADVRTAPAGEVLITVGGFGRGLDGDFLILDVLGVVSGSHVEGATGGRGDRVGHGVLLLPDRLDCDGLVAVRKTDQCADRDLAVGIADNGSFTGADLPGVEAITSLGEAVGRISQRAVIGQGLRSHAAAVSAVAVEDDRVLVNGEVGGVSLVLPAAGRGRSEGEGFRRADNVVAAVRPVDEVVVCCRGRSRAGDRIRIQRDVDGSAAAKAAVVARHEGERHAFLVPDGEEFNRCTVCGAQVFKLLTVGVIHGLGIGLCLGGCPAQEGIVIPGEGVACERLLHVVGEGLISHRAVAAVGVEANFEGNRIPGADDGHIFGRHGKAGAGVGAVFLPTGEGGGFIAGGIRRGLNRNRHSLTGNILYRVGCD